MKLINMELIGNPYNWVVVFVMCVFALIFLALVFPQSKTVPTGGA